MGSTILSTQTMLCMTIGTRHTMPGDVIFSSTGYSRWRSVSCGIKGVACRRLLMLFPLTTWNPHGLTTQICFTPVILKEESLQRSARLLDHFTGDMRGPYFDASSSTYRCTFCLRSLTRQEKATCLIATSQRGVRRLAVICTVAGCPRCHVRHQR